MFSPYSARATLLHTVNSFVSVLTLLFFYPIPCQPAWISFLCVCRDLIHHENSSTEIVVSTTYKKWKDSESCCGFSAFGVFFWNRSVKELF